MATQNITEVIPQVSIPRYTHFIDRGVELLLREDPEDHNEVLDKFLNENIPAGDHRYVRRQIMTRLEKSHNISGTVAFPDVRMQFAVC